jgi:2,3-bisphosphoglycerate-independent phosphoglycerate mutase
VNKFRFCISVSAQSQISDGGTLADVAPSMLALMGLPQPEEMQGRNLITIHNK